MVKLSEVNGAICSRFEVFPESIQWQGVGKREYRTEAGTFVYLDDKITVGEVDIYCVKCLTSGKVYASIADTARERKPSKEKVRPCK
jgi:esterase/lipase superfamily enzyme